MITKIEHLITGEKYVLGEYGVKQINKTYFVPDDTPQELVGRVWYKIETATKSYYVLQKDYKEND